MAMSSSSVQKPLESKLNMNILNYLLKCIQKPADQQCFEYIL